MDFKYTQENEDYRQQVRDWLVRNLPKGWGPRSVEPFEDEERAAFRLAWERKLSRGGWVGITWPKEYGGGGASPIELAIFLEESARLNAPTGINFIARNLVGPLLIAHGTAAQKQRFLPAILAAEHVWCQGFSEPNAGSDLASLRTKAELKGDRFVVNGQKIWTSFAQYSQWCILLVRTNAQAKKHRGLSFLLVPLDTPGITIRPIKRITGQSDFTAVFYDNVEIPAENLVGEIDEGWQIALSTLRLERGPEEALARQVRFQQQIDLLIETAATLKTNGTRAIDDPVVRQKLAASLIEVTLMRLNCLRGLSAILKGNEPGPEATFTKLYWSQMNQRMTEIAMEIQGPLATLTHGDPEVPANGIFQTEFLLSRAATIYAGTSEIQKNIISERVLGLPRKG